jgi:hypothetical protein
VRFVFDDGSSDIGAHRAVLCDASKIFQTMFENNMIEATTGEVRVAGISKASFRGFLEWIYLGNAQPHTYSQMNMRACIQMYIHVQNNHVKCISAHTHLLIT